MVLQKLDYEARKPLSGQHCWLELISRPGQVETHMPERCCSTSHVAK